MASGEPSANGKQLWIMPVVLELFAFPFAWISVQMLHDHEQWGAIAEYALAGILLSITGVAWAIFRKRIAESWPWRRLRIMEVELARVLQDNSELRKSLDASNETVLEPPNVPVYGGAISSARTSLPAPQVQSRLIKPKHNIQCVGFKLIKSEPFVIAALCFQNVPTPGKLMGKFEWPRLRVIYYEHSTGQEIADMAPIQWWDKKDGIIDISAEGRDADIASYFEGKWTASEIYSDENTLQSRLHSEDLPNGEIRINALLSGEYNNQPVAQVTGILTLGEDGTASFQRTTD